MSYRISYGPRRRNGHRWAAAGAGVLMLLWCAARLGPVWDCAAAGEGLYDALARFVGERILGAH